MELPFKKLIKKLKDINILFKTVKPFLTPQETRINPARIRINNLKKELKKLKKEVGAILTISLLTIVGTLGASAIPPIVDRLIPK